MHSADADVLVIGLGATGSQAAAECARRGLRVRGFDRFSPPHPMGSSHGRSRIIREAYFEDPIYVPLVQRAYARWAELEAESGEPILRRTGGLCYGPADGDLVRGARRSADTHGLPYELLDAAALRARFPAFKIDESWVGVLEPRAGMLDPERAITAALGVARRGGATIHCDEPVLAWHADANRVRVETARGTYEGDHLVIAAGMWAGALLRDLAIPFTVQRNVTCWFTPAREPARFAPDRFPIFLGEIAPRRIWYGFPDTGDGVKLARHRFGGATTPDAVDRIVSADEVSALRAVIGRYLPDANGALREAVVCTYTNLPDEQFILDLHPEWSRVVVASPCSGHGFKFAPAIGEVLADLVMSRPPRFDLTPFRLDRFGP